ncbi:MAG: multiheme c-type cytochrome [Planctomycetaceae bacterium]
MTAWTAIFRKSFKSAIRAGLAGAAVGMMLVPTLSPSTARAGEGVATGPAGVRPASLNSTPRLVDEDEPEADDADADEGSGSDVESDEQAVLRQAIDQAHAAVFENDCFPSAAKCATCHPQHYREWSVSPHAYAQLSPVFNAMSNKLNKLNNGTLADFCIRCHTPVGMALNEPINISNVNRPPSSREGVTCVVCHRVNQSWGKGAGRLALVSGNLHQAVYGPIGSSVLNDVLANPDRYGVLKSSPAPDVRGRDIHSKSFRFFQMTTSGFCGACHDVFAPNGFRLEDAFSEFKNSPSAQVLGHNCQDCHMGKVPGEACGYDYGPAAVIGNATTPPRKHTNHMIAGPDYSIIHRGLFPHNPKAIREEHEHDPLTNGLATMREWLVFDDAAGWGTREFEASVLEGTYFPPPWDDPEKRKEARRILEDQYELLAEYTSQRLQVLRAGYKLGHVEVEEADRDRIEFHVKVSNGTPGHGVPTGFDAERMLFLRVHVWDPRGRMVFQSGDLDPNGDVRDSHSFYVHNGHLPVDQHLFSLQSRFITRNIRGGEREQILNVPFSLDPLPYIRPETRPFTVLGRPIGARKHKQNIEAEGSRLAHYELSGKQVPGPGCYTVRVQMIAGMVPINLVQEISDIGFDYGMSAKAIAKGVVDGHLILHETAERIWVK